MARKVSKSSGDEEKKYKEHIAALEKRVKELEKESREEEPGMVTSVVGQLVPGLGGIVRTLERASPEFRQRIAETDAEIKHRLQSGWTSKPKIDYSVSVRPLVSGGTPTRRVRPEPVKNIRVQGKDREPIIDVIEEKDYMSVIADIPGLEDEDIKEKLNGNDLEITAGGYSKVVKLPSPAKSIMERTYKNGILHLKIKRK
jgi:HSP20 family protein